MLGQMKPLHTMSYAPAYLHGGHVGQQHFAAHQHGHHQASLHQQMVTLSDMPPLMLADGNLPPLYVVGRLAMSPSSSSHPDGSPVKICAVCGDRALSCNFGAITCESCKAFFRRNATRAQEMYSRCDERCAISVQSRSHCKHCRLLKCFSVGMRTELILTEEQKRERRQKIAENRQRRLLSGSTVLVSSMDLDSASASPPYDGAYAYDIAYGKVARWDISNHSVETYRPLPALVDINSGVRGALGGGQRSSPPSQQLLQQLSPPPISHGDLATGRSSVSGSGSGSSMDDDVVLVRRHASDHYEHHLHPSLKPAVLHGQTPDNLSPAKRQRLDDLTSLPLSSSPPGEGHGHAIIQDADLECVAQMSSQRAAMVYNLSHAFRLSFNHRVTQAQSLKTEGATVDFINMADLTIRRLVKMARCLPHFRALGQQHQIALLKGCVIDVLLLRSIKNFDSSRHGWMTQTSENKQFVSALAFKADPAVGAEHYRNYVTAAVALQEASRKDAVVLMLLTVLSVFNPKYLILNDDDEGEGRPTADEGQLAAATTAVQAGWAAYVDVLKEYLVVKYGDTDGSMYANMEKKLDDFLVLGVFHNELLKQTDACDLEPMVVEMFDLS